MVVFFFFYYVFKIQCVFNLTLVSPCGLVTFQVLSSPSWPAANTLGSTGLGHAGQCFKEVETPLSSSLCYQPEMKCFSQFAIDWEVCCQFLVATFTMGKDLPFDS